MAAPLSPLDDLRGRYLELAEDLIKHIALARDYATTPRNVWLARGEQDKAAGLLAELEVILDAIKAAEE